MRTGYREYTRPFVMGAIDAEAGEVDLDAYLAGVGPIRARFDELRALVLACLDQVRDRGCGDVMQSFATCDEWLTALFAARVGRLGLAVDEAGGAPS